MSKIEPRAWAAAPNRFETVAYVYAQTDLALLLGLLGSAGIWVVASGRGHASVEPDLTTALGGIELRVHVADAAEAHALLAALDPTPTRPTLFGLGRWFDLLVLGVAMFFGLGPPARTPPCFVGAAIVRRES